MKKDIRFMICRLCLCRNNGLINIFDSKGIIEYRAADVITEVLRHEVSAGDKYPQSVCIECMKKLKEFKRFKEKCDSCKELLDRAHAAKIIYSVPISQSEGQFSCGREEDKGQTVEVSVIPAGKPKAEAEEIEDRKPFMESINSMAEGGPLYLTQGQSACKRKAATQTVEVITPDIPAIVPKIKQEPCDAWDMVTTEMIDGQDVDGDDTENTNPFIETMKIMLNEDFPSETTQDSDAENCHESTRSNVEVHGCEYCGKFYNSSEMLMLHKYAHEGRPPWKCKLRSCNECGYSVSSKSKLADHIRSHTGEKPFSCADCGMRFPVKRNLVRHMRVRKSGRSCSCVSDCKDIS